MQENSTFCHYNIQDAHHINLFHLRCDCDILCHLILMLSNLLWGHSASITQTVLVCLLMNQNWLFLSQREFQTSVGTTFIHELPLFLLFFNGSYLTKILFCLGLIFVPHWMLKSFVVVPSWMSNPHPTTLLSNFSCDLMGPGGLGRLVLPQHWKHLSLNSSYDLLDPFFYEKVLEQLVDSDKKLCCCIIFHHPHPCHGFGLILTFLL